MTARRMGVRKGHQTKQGAILSVVGPGVPLQDTRAATEPLSAIWAAMSEREFQTHVEQALRDRGWMVFHVRDSRLMAAGLPDVLAVAPGRRMLLYELKRERRFRIRPAQAAVIAALAGNPGVDARIIRPSEWDAVLAGLAHVGAELGGEPAPSAVREEIEL